MHTTRLQIIEHLKEHGQAGVQELANAIGLTPMTIRHHLTVLETDGLVRSEKERGHVGRPRYAFSLTEDALSFFPERYDELAGRLLKGLKDLGAKREITQVLERMGDDIIDRHNEDLVSKSFEERLDVLVDVLDDEGFLASWENEAGEYVLTEYSCPYFLIGQDHPEICQIDWRVITSILEVPVKRQTCMLHGDTNCQFHIQADFDVAIADVN